MGKRKYGFITADQVKVGAVRGANMHTGSVQMPTRRVGVITSKSPRMVRAGEAHWGAMMPKSMAVNREIASGFAGTRKMVSRASQNWASRTGTGGMVGAVEDDTSTSTLRTAHAPGPGTLASGAKIEWPTVPIQAPPFGSSEGSAEEHPSTPLVLPERMERFAASRAGKFLEGRLEHAVDKRLGPGFYAAETGRGTPPKPKPGSPGPRPPF